MALVLSKVLTGEAHIRYFLLTGEGIRPVLLRVAGKEPRSKPLPDLFEVVACELSPVRNPSMPSYLKYWQSLARYDGLARHWEQMQMAAFWCALLQENARHTAQTQGWLEIARKALAAWNRGAESWTVLLKAIYLLAREEGLPVQQDWLQGLPSQAQVEAARLLQEKPPLGTEVLEPPKQLSLSLLAWLRESGDFRIPAHTLLPSC